MRASPGELQPHRGGSEDLLREFSGGHGHWVKRERQMCSERTRDPITLISVMYITWSGRREEEEPGDRGG